MACIAAAEIVNTVDLARFCLSAGCVPSPEDLRHNKDPHYIQPDDAQCFQRCSPPCWRRNSSTRGVHSLLAQPNDEACIGGNFRRSAQCDSVQKSVMASWKLQTAGSLEPATCIDRSLRIPFGFEGHVRYTMPGSPEGHAHAMKSWRGRALLQCANGLLRMKLYTYTLQRPGNCNPSNSTRCIYLIIIVIGRYHCLASPAHIGKPHEPLLWNGWYHADHKNQMGCLVPWRACVGSCT